MLNFWKSVQLTVIIVFITLNAPAKNFIDSEKFPFKGTVSDSITGKGIAYVTITIQDSSGIVQRLACDATGKFSFELKSPGKYNVLFHAVGYELRKKEITTGDKNLKADLGNILLNQSNASIGEVSVTARKPLIRVETDKIIYSNDTDPESKTSTVLEMLRKVPLVTVDGEDNIQVKGSSGFKILLNGKNSVMLSQNTREVLRSMPASSVRDIEVITNPSSKYEAEGATGIINIITNRKQLEGLMGNVNTGVNTYGGYNAGGYLSSKIKKLGISASYNYSDSKQPKNLSFSKRENFLSSNNHFTETEGYNKYHSQFNMLALDAGYELDSLNLISLTLFGYSGFNKSTGETMTKDFSIDQMLARHFENSSTGKNQNGSISGNIDYQRSFKKPDKTFTISYKLDNAPRRYESDNNVINLYNYISYHQKTFNDAVGREHTFQLDYYDPLTKIHQLEAGLKYILRQNISNSDILRLNESTGSWDRDLARINDLNYNQHIGAIYAGYLLKLKKVSIKTGLRMEMTFNDGLYKSLKDTSFTNKLFNIVPYITLSKNLKNGQNVKFSYTQRLSRPSIFYLNPFYNDTDPLNVRYGNPGLNAEITHSFDATYGKFSPKFNFNLSLNAAFTNNSITSVTTMSPNGVSTTTYQNIGKNQRFGGFVYGSANIGKKINLFTNLSLNYSILESNSSLRLQNQGFSYSGFFNARYRAWKNGYVAVNSGLFSPGIMLQGRGGKFYYYNVSLGQEMFNKKLRLNVSVDSPFEEKRVTSSKFEDPTFRLDSKTYNYIRMVRFNVYYSFGKLKDQVKKAKRSIKNDDLKSNGESTGGNN